MTFGTPAHADFSQCCARNIEREWGSESSHCAKTGMASAAGVGGHDILAGCL
jgi:hypothetical protein